MAIWKMTPNLADMAASRKNTLVEHIGIEFTAFTDDSLTARMPVDHRTIQPHGIMHGGASCVLAETLGSVAAYYCIDSAQATTVGLDIHTSHIRMAKDGYVTGTAKPIHIGKTTQVWDIRIVNEEGNLVSVTRLTLAILSKPPSSLK